MVFIDIDNEMKRIKKEEKQAEKQSYCDTEKQMEAIWILDDAKRRTELALKRLKTARAVRNYTIRRRVLTEPKLENLVISH